MQFLSSQDLDAVEQPLDSPGSLQYVAALMHCQSPWHQRVCLEATVHSPSYIPSQAYHKTWTPTNTDICSQLALQRFNYTSEQDEYPTLDQH